MVILILFHSGSFRCFKHYYKEYVCKYLKKLFPRFYQESIAGTCTGISFVDSTLLHVCRNPKILIHKIFEGLAEREKCSMEWFFGFKLHLIINDKGESSISCSLLETWMTENL